MLRVTTLKDRLTEIMGAMGWDHAALVEVSGQSSSVVSQWLGKGSKEIKSIGKFEAAMAIERASGYRALWVAKGYGPKRVESSSAIAPARVMERPAGYGDGPGDMESHLNRLGRYLAEAPNENRQAICDVLQAWVMSGGGHGRVAALRTLLIAHTKST